MEKVIEKVTRQPVYKRKDDFAEITQKLSKCPARRKKILVVVEAPVGLMTLAVEDCREGREGSAEE